MYSAIISAGLPKKTMSKKLVSSRFSLSTLYRLLTAMAKLATALDSLHREDPTFGCKTDPETGQTVISGMGELHLEVLQHKLIREKKVDVRVGKPRVAYREAITKAAEGEGKFVHQSGGHGQFGHVVLAVEPLLAEDGHYETAIAFDANVTPDKVPKEYISSVEQGVREAIGSGMLAGYPVVGFAQRLAGGCFHSVDSSDLAFEQAATMALEKAIREAGPVLLEPVMRVQAVVPESGFGAVQADLLARRGLIRDCRVHGNMRIVDATVPLVELFGYSSDIRSLTAGRGSFTMEPLSYERVPEQVAKAILF